MLDITYSDVWLQHSVGSVLEIARENFRLRLRSQRLLCDYLSWPAHRHEHYEIVPFNSFACASLFVGAILDSNGWDAFVFEADETSTGAVQFHLRANLLL